MEDTLTLQFLTGPQYYSIHFLSQELILINYRGDIRIMQAPSLTPTFVDQFLSVIDQISVGLGLNEPQILTIEYLSMLPTESLGYQWAFHLKSQGLQPFTTGPRRKQLHDGVHVLTGYGTDLMGEMEVQAFLLGCHFRFSHLILLLGLTRLSHEQGLWITAEQSIDLRLRAAYERGCRSSFDLDGWQPEQNWGIPLTAVRTFYQL